MSIKVWSLETFACMHTFKDHSNTVFSLFLLDDSRIISGSSDKTLKVWDIQNFRCIKSISTSHKKAIYSITCLSGGRVCTASWDLTIKVFNIESGTCLKTFKAHNKDILILNTLHDGSIISGAMDSKLKIWDDESFECLGVYDFHNDWIRTITLMENGNIITSGDDRKIIIWGKRHAQNETDYLDRVRYILSDKCKMKFSVKLKNVTLKCPKSLLLASMIDEGGQEEDGENDLLTEGGAGEDKPPSKSDLTALVGNLTDEDELSFPEVVIEGLDEEVFLKILFGIEFKFKKRTLFRYYRFFELLNLKKHMYIICKIAEKVLDYSVLLELFSKTCEKYEGGHVAGQGGGTFLSPFTAGVYNAFVNYFPRVDGDYRYYNRLEEFKKTYGDRTVIVKKHSVFAKVLGDETIFSFSHIFKENLRKIYERKMFNNLKLIPSDRGSFSVNREIVVYRSNFFFKLLSFPGQEARECDENNEVHIATLSFVELKYLLQFLYSNYIQSHHLITLFNLYNFSKIYFEYDLEKYLTEKINRIIENVKEFEIQMKNYGYLFQEYNLVEMLIDYCVSKEIDKSTIISLLEESTRIHQFKYMYEKLDELSEYESRLKDLEAQDKKQREINKSLIIKVKNQEIKINKLETKLKSLLPENNNTNLKRL